MPRLATKAAAAKAPPGPEQDTLPDTPAEPAEPSTPPPAKKAAAKKAVPAKAADSQSVDEFGFVSLDETTDFLNVLAYGREGTAKTTSAATAANAAVAADHKGRVLVINAEGGLKVVALRKRGIDTSRIVVWPDPKSGVQITKRTLEGLHERLLTDLTKDPDSWFAVVIDSTTDVHQALREQATNKRIDKLMNKPGADTSVIDPDFVDRDDYGVMTSQLRVLIRRFRDLPCHVILTALERVDDATKVVGPALTPAIATDVLGYVDITMYMRATLHATGEDDDDSLAEFRALTRPGKVTRAKDRFDLLPRVLVEPTFERVLGYVRGDLEEASDPLQIAYVQRRQAEKEAAAAAEAEAEAAKQARKPARGTKAAAAAETGE